MSSKFRKLHNPLYYDLESLPNNYFEDRRALAIYKKDVKELKTIERHGLKYQVGKRKRKDTIQSWLPSTDLFVITTHETQKLYDLKSIGIFATNKVLREYPEILWKHMKAKHPNLVKNKSIIYVMKQDIHRINTEFLTPLMMMHDVMETIYQRSQYSYFREKTFELHKNIQMLVRVGGKHYRFTPYIPKLVFLHPDFEARQFNLRGDDTRKRKGWFFIRAAAGAFFDRGGLLDNNYLSDVWSIWCKKENISPSDFFNPVYTTQEILAVIDKRFAHGTQYAKVVLDPRLSLQSYCDALNILFSKWLKQLKGTIIS